MDVDRALEDAVRSLSAARADGAAGICARSVGPPWEAQSPGEELPSAAQSVGAGVLASEREVATADSSSTTAAPSSARRTDPT